MATPTAPQRYPRARPARSLFVSTSSAYQTLNRSQFPLEWLVLADKGGDVGDDVFSDAAMGQRILIGRRKALAFSEQMVELRIELEFDIGAVAQRLLPVLEVLYRYLVIPNSLEDEHRPVNLQRDMGRIIAAQVQPVCRRGEENLFAHPGVRDLECVYPGDIALDLVQLLPVVRGGISVEAQEIGHLPKVGLGERFGRPGHDDESRNIEVLPGQGNPRDEHPPEAVTQAKYPYSAG